MATTIEVNKKSVEELLGSGRTRPFVIPEYQRPYSWTDEQVETLFEDLWEFTANTYDTPEPQSESPYFLGSVVSYENQDGEQEIIDGQQRITSLFLLLRAIYAKLADASVSTKTPEATNFIRKIEPIIWKTDNLTGVVNFKKVLLTSHVINDDENKIFQAIMENGCADKKATDNYSKNYRYFQELLDQHAKKDPLRMYQFIYVLLNQAILLPITADDRETALTIFSTLNDRGLSLSDADIFKAEIYKHLDSDAKSAFISRWKDLTEQAANANESVQQLFYYTMFYYRAKANDTKTTTPGIRKYYSANHFEPLYNPELMDTLFIVLNLWKVINSGEEIEGESWSKNIRIKQVLDALSSYPNEFWKYPVITYYLCHRSKEHFEEKFDLFLHKLLTELMVKYLTTPTVNAVKADILKLDSAIVTSEQPVFEVKGISLPQISEYIKTPHRSIVRMLLKILAYEKQDSMLPSQWEIEHIFPQKWQSNYFPTESTAEIKEKIEHIGNKLPFEKKLNIIAGNGYFSKKKKEYTASSIRITKKFGESDITDWNMDSIIERDIRITDDIIRILSLWDTEYARGFTEDQAEKPSAEDLAQINEFRKKGWI